MVFDQNLINDLKSKIKLIDGNKEQINLLKESLPHVEHCLIITAGPSLKRIDLHNLKRKYAHSLVISIKQTFDLAEEITDIHLINPYNYKKYDYSKRSPFIIETNFSYRKKWIPFKSDIIFNIKRSNCKRELSLAALRNFDDYLFENENNNRPFGPGIVYEMAIYLPLFFGIKNITIVGWDIGQKDSNVIERFYERKSFIREFEDKLKERLVMGYNLLRVGKNLANILLYKFGCSVTLNDPGITRNEAKFIADSTESFYQWLVSKDISFNIISDRSIASSKIPREIL